MLYAVLVSHCKQLTNGRAESVNETSQKASGLVWIYLKRFVLRIYYWWDLIKKKIKLIKAFVMNAS